MGGRGSKKFTTGVLPLALNQRNKGINFPGARRANPINQADFNAIEQEYQRRMAQDKAWAAQLTGEEMTAAYDYQGADYAEMNYYLREKGEGRTYGITPDTRVAIRELTSALDKASLPEAVTVYRGVRGKELTWDQAQKMVGTHVVDHAFGSTTLNSQFAKEWAGYKPHSGSYAAKGTADSPYVSYRITVPKGAKAAYVGAATFDAMAGEHELLIQRGATYRIDGVQQRVIGGKHYIFLNTTYTGQSNSKK